MWLVTSAVAATTATVLSFIIPKKYNLRFLSLMLWGATIMILVDHLLEYQGGSFLEKTTEGLIRSGSLLGIVMLIPVMVIWIISLLFSKFKKEV